MNRIVVYLRANWLFLIACVLMLSPLILLGRVVIIDQFPRGGSWLFYLTAIALIVLAGLVISRDRWKRRQFIATVLVAAPLVAPFLLFYGYIVWQWIDAWLADRQAARLTAQISRDGQAAVSEIAVGWHTVCACSLNDDYDFPSCESGRGPERWQLKFYRDSVDFRAYQRDQLQPYDFYLEVPMPGLTDIAADRPRCFTLDQEPVISRDPLHGDLLTLMPRPSPSGAAK